MKTGTIRLALACLVAGAASALAERPPAAPLVVNDPYFSIWSMADNLYDDTTRHWTGTPHPLVSLLRVDGKVFRLMGGSERGGTIPAAVQRSLQAWPTRTVYEFEAAGAVVTMTFLTPFLPHDLDVLSRPVTYITWTVKSADQRSHAASIYFEAASDIVVNTADQPVNWWRLRMPGIRVLRMGSREQPVLQKSGDNLRGDWGYLYMAAPDASGVSEAASERATARDEFVANGALIAADAFGEHNPRTRYSEVRSPVLALSFDLGSVGAQAVSRYALLAYDDLYSLEYFNRRVRPYWRRAGADAPALLKAAAADYESLSRRCAEFDQKLMADLEAAGGREYAQLCALAYRQSIAAHKLAVDNDGSLLFFSKENFSNGCINTVDVFYPSAPLFLLMNTKLLRGSVEPILAYASMSRWPWPYAPHDLGTYPLANGQVYGGGEQSEDATRCRWRRAATC